MDRLTPGLAGIPETMLWTLHNRADEAKRPDGLIHDPEAIRIYDALDYDFVGRFGRADGSHAWRAMVVDRAIRHWLESHPDGMVVALGEGLETQRHRVDNGRLRWLTVDLPEAIAIRERFLAPTARFRHVAADARDPAWMAAVDARQGVFIVAQGLFMYLQPADVHGLLNRLADRFPGAPLIFDVVPAWFSRATLRGFHKTRSYRLPPMPWGIDRNAVVPTLKAWEPRLTVITIQPYRMPRGGPRIIMTVLRTLPVLRNKIPLVIEARFAEA